MGLSGDALSFVNADSLFVPLLPPPAPRIEVRVGTSGDSSRSTASRFVERTLNCFALGTGSTNRARVGMTLKWQVWHSDRRKGVRDVLLRLASVRLREHFSRRRSEGSTGEEFVEGTAPQHNGSGRTRMSGFLYCASGSCVRSSKMVRCVVFRDTVPYHFVLLLQLFEHRLFIPGYNQTDMFPPSNNINSRKLQASCTRFALRAGSSRAWRIHECPRVA